LNSIRHYNHGMQIVDVGSFFCEFCKQDIPTRVHADNPDLILEHRDEALAAAKNYHWYDNHYNCAVCGEWIPSGERELVVEREFDREINPKYNNEVKTGLLRVHKKCV
jgi:hypothetical protein